MRKLYCKNCRYESYRGCRYFIDKVNPYNGELMATMHYQLKGENESGNYSHYKRKWWKFWLKRKD